MLVNYLNSFFSKSPDKVYHIVAATENPAKIESITAAFNSLFGSDACRIESVHIDNSHVDQPIGDKETRRGARNRVMTARQVRPEADFWVGIEAGIEDDMTFAWIAIENELRRGESRSASIMLPTSVINGINQGDELSTQMIELTGQQDISKQGGAIGYFTDGKLTRSTVYEQALILALVPFFHDAY